MGFTVVWGDQSGLGSTEEANIDYVKPGVIITLQILFKLCLLRQSSTLNFANAQFPNCPT